MSQFKSCQKFQTPLYFVEQVKRDADTNGNRYRETKEIRTRSGKLCEQFNQFTLPNASDLVVLQTSR